MSRFIFVGAPFEVTMKLLLGGLYMYFKVKFWRRLTKKQKLRLLRQKAHINLIDKNFIA